MGAGKDKAPPTLRVEGQSTPKLTNRDVIDSK